MDVQGVGTEVWLQASEQVCRDRSLVFPRHLTPIRSITYHSKRRISSEKR
jgi:hypothetical protein